LKSILRKKDPKMAYDSKRSIEKTLHFDGVDDTKWDAWSFKMFAFASKKMGHKDAFTTNFEFGDDKTKWTEAEKANKVLMEAVWSQIVLTVHEL
jgi:hypothetical protein